MANLEEKVNFYISWVLILTFLYAENVKLSIQLVANFRLLNL